jgi:prolyl 4-hydroxylase
MPATRMDFLAPVADRLSCRGDTFVIEGRGLTLYLSREFLNDDECDRIAALVDANKHPSTVLGLDPERTFRTSESSPLGHLGHPLIGEIDERLADFMGIDPKFGETLEGQRYAVGQEFKPHCDYFHTSESYWPEQDRIGGQRTWSVVLCLKAPEVGGGTMFPEAGVRMKPRKGNLLAWCNLDAGGDVNPMSLHCGEPVEEGVKYIATKWFRERKVDRSRFEARPEGTQRAIAPGMQQLPLDLNQLRRALTIAVEPETQEQFN